MDRDTLQDDLDLILGPEPGRPAPRRVGLGAPARDGRPRWPSSATEPTEPEETETAGDSEDGTTEDEEDD